MCVNKVDAIFFAKFMYKYISNQIAIQKIYVVENIFHLQNSVDTENYSSVYL